MSRTLTFDVQPQYRESEEGIHYLYVAVQPFADGEALLCDPESYVFDASAVLARRITPSELYPFTCSCGVPGCAGIHDPARLTVSGGQIVWTFPAQWLRADLNPRLFPAGQPLAIAFDRDGYETALDLLILRLCELEGTLDLPVIWAPGSVWADDLGQPVEARLQADRERFQQWQAGQTWRHGVFGDLLRVEVRAELKAGLVYATAVENLAYFMAERIIGEGGDDGVQRQRDWIASQLAPLFRESPAAILDAIHGYSWAEIETLMWPHLTGEAGACGADSDTDLAPLWSNARLSLAEEAD